MNKNLNEQLVAFKRGCILVRSKKQELPKNNVALISLIEELAQFGYALKPEIMVSISQKEIKEVFKYVIPEIQKELLYGHLLVPLYPGFPAQTAGMTEQKMREDQLRCYDGDVEGFLRDNPWRVPVTTSKAVIKNHLDLMTEKEFMEIPQRLMGSNNSLTVEDKELLEWFLYSYKNLEIPERIPFKETLCIVLKYRPELVRDVNDIVRYGLYMMGADPCLPHIPKKIKMNSWSSSLHNNPNHRRLESISRKSRREILGMIEKVLEKKGFANCVKDAKKLYGSWFLLSERLHPGNYSKRFPETWKFFHTLKTKEENKKFRTWYSVLQEMYNTGKPIVDIAKYVASRPGELVRRFDSLIRRDKCKYSAEVLDIFVDTSGMKNKTLLSFYDYFDRRNGKRIVFIPGNRKPHELEPLPPLDPEVLKMTKNFIWKKINSNIKESVKEKDLTGKTVILDEKIKNILIPVSMRDNQSQTPSGTRFEIPEMEGTVRFFVHWVQEPKKFEDLDLHSYIYNMKSNKSETIGWNRDHITKYASYSGDVRGREGDCAEFIDIDLKEAKKAGWTHVLATVNNFTGRGFNTLECTLGYMLRRNQQVEDGNIDWYPLSTDIEHSIRPVTASSSIMAFLVNIKERTVMILDKDLKGIPVSSEYDYSGFIKFFSRKPEVTSYDVLKCWYEARGAEVVSEAEKDTEKEIIEVTFQDILDDYTKVLQAIGE